LGNYALNMENPLYDYYMEGEDRPLPKPDSRDTCLAFPCCKGDFRDNVVLPVFIHFGVRWGISIEASGLGDAKSIAEQLDRLFPHNPWICFTHVLGNAPHFFVTDEPPKHYTKCSFPTVLRYLMKSKNAEQATAKFKAFGYPITITRTGVKVGCSTFPTDAFRKIRSIVDALRYCCVSGLPFSIESLGPEKETVEIALGFRVARGAAHAEFYYFADIADLCAKMESLANYPRIEETEGGDPAGD